MDPNDIEPGRYYSVRALAKMGILPWRSAYTVARMMREDKWKAIFQPMADEKKSSVRLHIRGENILKYMKMVESGELST